MALDLETTTGTPPCTNDYVKAMQLRHPDRIIHAWAAVDPFKGEVARAEAQTAIRELGMLGFHFHPIMGHFAVNDRQFYPLFEVINALKVPVMIDVGTTGMGAGMPGGLGAKIRHAHPAAIDELAADFPDLTIIAAHPGWPWVDEMTAVALHKGNVFWEMSGWAPKYFPAQLKTDIRARLQDKVMFGSDYPSIPLRPPVQGMGRARLCRRRDGEDLPRQRRADPRPVTRAPHDQPAHRAGDAGRGGRALPSTASRADFPTIEFNAGQSPRQDRSPYRPDRHHHDLRRDDDGRGLPQGARLKWVQVLGTGVDRVIEAPSLAPDVIVTNIHGIHGAPVAEARDRLHARARPADAALGAGAGPPRNGSGFPSRLLDGKTVAIFGIGVIAAALAPKLQALGMRVVGISSAPRAVPGFDRVHPRDELPRPRSARATFSCCSRRNGGDPRHRRRGGVRGDEARLLPRQSRARRRGRRGRDDRRAARRAARGRRA